MYDYEDYLRGCRERNNSRIARVKEGKGSFIDEMLQSIDDFEVKMTAVSIYMSPKRHTEVLNHLKQLYILYPPTDVTEDFEISLISELSLPGTSSLVAEYENPTASDIIS